MFPNFQKQYVATSRVASTAPGLATLPPESFGHVTDAIKFLVDYEGTTFTRELYRLLSLCTTEKWNRLIVAAFPDYEGRIWPFGCDWLGKMFVLDSQTMENGTPMVLMMELGTGYVLQIPATFKNFHEEQLIENADPALAVTALEEWMMSHPVDLRRYSWEVRMNLRISRSPILRSIGRLTAKSWRRRADCRTAQKSARLLYRLRC